METPDYLFRYCSAQRAKQVLREKRLYLCPPTDFNDLYEGTLHRISLYNHDAAFQLAAKIASIRHKIPVDEANKLIRARMPESEAKKTFEDIVNWLRDPADKMRLNSGLTCFSINGNDQRMWATYADNHSGVCIQFTNRSGASQIHKRAQPVLYTDNSLANYVSDFIKDNLSLDIYKLALWIYFVKSRDWVGESEWRVFTLSTTPISQEERYLTFDSCDVARIFCGPRMKDSDRHELEEIKKQGNDWSIFDLKPNVHAAEADIEGVEILKDMTDFRFWFPEVFDKSK